MKYRVASAGTRAAISLARGYCFRLASFCISATGVLLSIGECVFLLTAAHAIEHFSHSPVFLPIDGRFFLVGPESSETAKILDFGIAKFVPNYGDARTAETATGAILGTPRYMSPEQRGRQSVHHSWDLWALAVMTYEMLTGFYPFEDGAYDWLAPGPQFHLPPLAGICQQRARAGRCYSNIASHANSLVAMSPSSRFFLSCNLPQVDL